MERTTETADYLEYSAYGGVSSYKLSKTNPPVLEIVFRLRDTTNLPNGASTWEEIKTLLEAM